MSKPPKTPAQTATDAAQTVTDPAQTVTFLSDVVPPLRDGDYRVQLTQQMPKAMGGVTYQSRAQRIAILGPRFVLQPSDIHAVFPADGSTGDHSDTLPHVGFDRKTLPWERNPVRMATQDKKQSKPPSPSLEKDEAICPWLGVILLSEDEMTTTAQASTRTAQLRRTTRPEGDRILPADLAPETETWPDLHPEIGEEEGDLPAVRLLAVEADLLGDVLPNTLTALALSANARKGASDTIGSVMATRLPRFVTGDKSGGIRAFLVSLEGHYGEDEKLIVPAQGHKLFVVLHSWRFRISDPEKTFDKALGALDAGPMVRGLAQPADATAPKHDPARTLLGAGYVALGHQMRETSQLLSWYRGPLQPYRATRAKDASGPDALASANSGAGADAVLRYQTDTQMLDCSHAAAWTLGRADMLADRHTAHDLAAAKRKVAQAARARARRIAQEDILLRPTELQDPDLSRSVPSVAKWVDERSLLKSLPFRYIVPDLRLLPLESLRVFSVDPEWMAAYFAGALSVGYVAGHDDNLTSIATAPIKAAWRYAKDGLCGALLRSAAVSDFAKMTWQGWANRQNHPDAPTHAALPVRRADHLAPDLLLLLFSGPGLGTLSFHMPHEHLHFGFETSDAQTKTATQKLRDPQNGIEIETDGLLATGLTKHGHVDLATLYDEIDTHLTKIDAAKAKAFNRATFALNMIQGAKRVTFHFIPDPS